MSEVRIKITPQQNQILNSITHKYTSIPKGRRFGITHAMCLFSIKWLLEKPRRILWGDTVHGNIERYFDLYIRPVLNQLPKGSWHWDKVYKKLRIINSQTNDCFSENASYMDFRSADNPMNWEGFGYHFILLNEAGIILKDTYLYRNAILPMLLDFTDSKLIAFGAPKGRTTRNGEEHPFYSLVKKAETHPKTHRSLTYTSYDSAVASKEDVDALIEEYGGANSPLAQQEIFAKFVDVVDLPFLHAFSRDVNIHECEFNPYLNLYLCFDFNVKSTCLVIQHDENSIRVIEEIHDDLDSICFHLKSKYPLNNCYVNGDASGNNDNASNETFYEIVRNNLDLSFEFNFRVPRANPRHKASYNQCNYIFKHFIVYINPLCKQLIRDCEMVQIIQKNGKIEIDKSDQTLTHHLDPLRYHINAEHLEKIGITFNDND